MLFNVCTYHQPSSSLFIILHGKFVAHRLNIVICHSMDEMSSGSNVCFVWMHAYCNFYSMRGLTSKDVFSIFNHKRGRALLFLKITSEGIFLFFYPCLLSCEGIFHKKLSQVHLTTLIIFSTVLLHHYSS